MTVLSKSALGALAILGILFGVCLMLVLIAGTSGMAKVQMALQWTQILAGILITLGGVVGAGMATLNARGTDRMVVAGLAPGSLGVLGGTVLLGVDHWSIAAALGVAGLGGAIAFGIRRG
jgi:hypothetical protein